MNIIKTAIITIIISFISGLLLNYFTNLGPRILCNVRNGKPKKMDNKENFAYIVSVKNPSKKTIHELTVNIQNSGTTLKSTDFKITSGLKFDSTVEDNVLEVYIPFLSTGDEFSVTVYLENQDTVQKKPIIVIRSPENFKEIDSSEKKGILLALSNIPKNIEQVMNKITGNEETTNKEKSEMLSGNKKVSKNKKVIIIIVLFVLIVIVIAGVSTKLLSQGQAANSLTNSSEQSNGTKGLGVGTNATNGTKGSDGKNKVNSSTKGSAGETNSSTGAGSSGSGVATNSSTGAGSSDSGVATNSSTGAGSSGSGAANSSTGAGSSGSGAANSSTGAGSSGSGVANSSTGSGSSGVAANSSTGSATNTTTGK